jgi:hypothetical protein
VGDRLIAQANAKVRALVRGGAADKLRGADMQEVILRLKRARVRTAAKGAARTRLQVLLKDEFLIERANAIMRDRLTVDGGGYCDYASKEGRAALIRETIKRLNIWKQRKDPDEVMYFRATLEAFIAEDERRQGGRPEMQDRDETLAREFQARRRRAPHYVSNSKLMEQIGSEQGHGQELKRSQAIKAITRGLKKLSAKTV